MCLIRVNNGLKDIITGIKGSQASLKPLLALMRTGASLPQLNMLRCFHQEAVTAYAHKRAFTTLITQMELITSEIACSRSDRESLAEQTAERRSILRVLVHEMPT